MTNEELQAKYDRLVDKIRRMRAYQREYFKYRASSDLQLAKRFEKEVDKLIEEEVKVQKSKQSEIFKDA